MKDDGTDGTQTNTRQGKARQGAVQSPQGPGAMDTDGEVDDINGSETQEGQPPKKSSDNSRDGQSQSIDVLVGGKSDGVSDRGRPTASIKSTPSYDVSHYSKENIIECPDTVWGTFEPYVETGRPLKIAHWRNMCPLAANDTSSMASPDPEIPAEALDQIVTVQCRRATPKPASLLTECEKECREARLEIDAALSVGDSRGNESNLFLGQEDQITTQMSLSDVVDRKYDSDLMKVCVAQETILASPQAETSTSIIVGDNGRVHKEGDGAAAVEPLATLASWIRAPSSLLPSNKIHVREVNLWYAPCETRTNTHYDGNHNILIVLKGTKTIELCPSNVIRGSPIHSEHANHPALWRSVEVGWNCPVFPSFEKELHAMRNNFKSRAVVVSISAGEAIFIPEGWWHRVESSADCLAVNFWFDHNTASTAMFARPSSSHMLPYQAREVVRMYVDANFDRIANILLKEAQKYEKSFLSSREKRIRDVDIKMRRKIMQRALGDDAMWARVASEGYSDLDLKKFLELIAWEAEGMQRRICEVEDPTPEKMIKELVAGIHCVALSLSVFLTHIKLDRDRDRRAVINLFVKIFSPHKVHSEMEKEAWRKWLFLEIILRLESEACFVLSRVWELHQPAEEAQESFILFFSSCSNADIGRKHFLFQVDNFKQKVVQRLINQDLMLVSTRFSVIDISDQEMQERLLAAEREEAPP